MSNIFEKVEKDLGNQTLVYTFVTGKSLAINVSDYPESIQTAATTHGIDQKLRDCVAGIKKYVESAGGDPAELAFEWMSELHEQLASGAWRGASGTTGERGPRVESLDDLAQAIVRFAATKGESRDAATVRAKLEAMDKKARGTIARDPNIRLHIATIRAERAPATDVLAAF